MSDLGAHLERLGLDGYLNAFIGEGFDTWETLLDIQESDLESLNVKLGHRRKLQRAIAEYRGVSYERLLGSPAGEGPSDPMRHTEASQTPSNSKDGPTTAPTETKRKYRRHPKPDENAPDKPPSAYVIFSNKVREEVKVDNLSFTEIAKLVGDRWQKLDTAHKEPFETQANALKDAYNIQSTTYKKTELYKEYCQYLEDFKIKHGPNSEAKRPKLDPQSSTGSASMASVASQEVTELAAAHRRVGSLESNSTATYPGTIQSPATSSLTPVSSLQSLTSSINWPAPPAPLITRAGSPTFVQHSVDRRLVAPLSTQSSLSDESGHSRLETYDPLSRAATLSLSTPPAGTPPLPSHVVGPARSEHGSIAESFTWSARLPPNTPQYTPTAPSPHGSITLPSPTLSIDPWRDRGAEGHRSPPNSGLVQPGTFAGTLPTPTVAGPERISEMMRASTQRTLPPLRQPSGIQQQFVHQGGLPVSGLFHHPGTTNPQFHESGPRPVTENEAANTLAGLANRHAPTPRETAERRRPH